MQIYSRVIIYIFIRNRQDSRFKGLREMEKHVFLPTPSFAHER